MAAFSGIGTVLNNGSTNVANVVSISAINLSADLADVTTLASSSNYEETLSTVLRTGELTFSVLFDPDETSHGTTLSGSLGIFENQGTGNTWTITWDNAGASTWEIDGTVTGIAYSIEREDVVRADITVKGTSYPVLTS